MARYHKQSGPKRRPARLKRRRYLIVSEDSKSSLDYLTAFPVDPNIIEIVPEGGAGNTVDVVKRGIEMQKTATKDGQPFVHVYCVFDKDDFELNRYQGAFIEAGKHNDVTAIWANQCFELWYLLHFAYHNSGIHRSGIYRKLETPDRLGKHYDKGDASIYDKLLDKRDVAIRNGDKLLVSARDELPNQPWAVNPSTNVQDVVRKLVDLGELGKT
jgi:hypothetical protein